MKFYLDENPIIACSTGNISNTALGVIRLSGFKSLENFAELFSIKLSDLKPRTVYRTNIIDQSLIIDNILITFFEAASSYNGENILELYVHGNQLNIELLIYF